MKPIPRKGRHQASVSPANKKKCMQANVTFIVTKDDQVIHLEARKEHDYKPAHLMDVFTNLANITDPDIVGIYRVARGVPYDSVVVVMLEVQDGESLMTKIKRQRVAFDKAMETFTILTKRLML